MFFVFFALRRHEAAAAAAAVVVAVVILFSFLRYLKTKGLRWFASVCMDVKKPEKRKEEKKTNKEKQPSEASPLCRRTALHYGSSVCPYLMATFSPIAGQYLSLQASPEGSQQLCNINSIFTSTLFSFFFFFFWHSAATSYVIR